MHGWGGVLDKIQRPDGKIYERLNTRVQNLFRDSEAVAKDYTATYARMIDGSHALIEECVHQTLSGISLDRLSEAESGLRLSSLRDAGYTNLEQLSRLSQADLESIRGVGEQTALQIRTAVQDVVKTAREKTRVRMDPEHPTPVSTDLIKAIGKIRKTSAFARKSEEFINGSRAGLTSDLSLAKLVKEPVRWLFAGQDKKAAAVAALNKTGTFLDSGFERDLAAANSSYLSQKDVGDAEAWEEFRHNSVEYYTILESASGVKAKVETTHGNLPQGLVENVEAQTLNSSLMKTALRGYQEFGAKYAIVQSRTLLGDEMGLGKTVEAIAAMSHLKTEGAMYFEVVCPASVLVNWVREITRHSELATYRLHGDDRDSRLAAWLKNGGVAVTTYETLKVLQLPEGMTLDMLIADEAHYAKNPGAQRTKAIKSLITRAKRVLFMTGTPIENSLDEMRNLIGFLQPELAKNMQGIDYLAGPDLFRQSIAPVYLRRNREDVLQELPPLVEMEEWVEFGPTEAEKYREAVAVGQFMQMRRIAWTGGTPDASPKLDRLLDLCQDAKENNRKILVFSFFLDVLAVVCRELGEDALEPITGSVSPARRQQIIDEFKTAPAGATLVCQIQAGGVGLNIQEASVVIFCEPQIKPALETQAISRAYRMGQTNSVVVHRLLTEDSIDERMMEILDTKEQIFDSYARDSVVAESSTQAVDITEKSLKERILSQEQKRLGLAGNQGTGEDAETVTEETAATTDTREPAVAINMRKAAVAVDVQKSIAAPKETSPEMTIPTNFCAYCGSRLKPDALFCTGCGKKIE
jgi:superfamily II DNA or RNA helicase